MFYARRERGWLRSVLVCTRCFFYTRYQHVPLKYHKEYPSSLEFSQARPYRLDFWPPYRHFAVKVIDAERIWHDKVNTIAESSMGLIIFPMKMTNINYARQISTYFLFDEFHQLSTLCDFRWRYPILIVRDTR